MNNYIKYSDKITFHPGYYIEEFIDESGLTQEDFAKSLSISSENLNLILMGKKNISMDIAMKLAGMFGTSVDYWLNLQKQYDACDKDISNDLLIHPGETISDILMERGITQEELAERTGFSTLYVNEVVSGRVRISIEFAQGLEKVLGVKESFWINLQANYDAELEGNL